MVSCPLTNQLIQELREEPKSSLAELCRGSKGRVPKDGGGDLTNVNYFFLVAM